MVSNLIDQPLSTLFQGVSKQPDTVRIPGQVEAADNADFSVVTGGFSKRTGTIHVNKLPEIASDATFSAYAYSRDSSEAYYILVIDGDLLVYSISDGTLRTVNISDGTRYISKESDATILGSRAAANISYPASETQIDLTSTGVAGGLTFSVEGSDTGEFAGEESTLATFTTDTTQTVTIKPYIRTKVTVAGTGTFTVTGTFQDITYLSHAVQSAVIPSNIFASLSQTDKAPSAVVSSDGLTASGSVSNQSSRTTFGVSSGKYYWEANYGGGTTGMALGVGNGSMALTTYAGETNDSWGLWSINGEKIHNAVYTAYGTAMSPTDIMMFALDMDSGKVWFGVNGTWFNSGDPAAGTNEAFSGLTGTIYPLGSHDPRSSPTYNFGKSGFAHTPPAGFDPVKAPNEVGAPPAVEPEIAGGNDFAFTSIGDVTLILNRSFIVSLEAPGTGTVAGIVQKFSDLPATPTIDDIYEITGSDADGFTGYFVKATQTSPVVWEETVDPNGRNTFDVSTMPHKLTRDADGTFTFAPVPYNAREAGDETLTPAPDFVDERINDLTFAHARLCFIAGESPFFSRTNDFFNFWPEKASDALDDDPFGLSAPKSDVNKLRFAVPFNKATFTTSDKHQFEITTTDTFTARNVSIEPTTNYRASEICRPLPVGDILLFASKLNENAAIFEYYFDQNSLSNTAEDITKHAQGYIPAEVVSMTGDAVVGKAFLITEADRPSLYVYTYYWQNGADGQTKVQSSWGRWKFGASEEEAYVHSAVFIQGALYLIIRRGTETCLEMVPATDEFNDNSNLFRVTDSVTPWGVRLDRRVMVAGTYDALEDETTWTTPYEHADEAVVILPDDFTDQGGMKLLVSYPTATTVKATGDYSAHSVYIGIPYTMSVTLSKIYPREGQDSRALTSGRLQLRRMFFDYSKTGYFTVKVTPETRDPKTYAFSGRVIGNSANIIGQVPIVARGTFKARIGSRADTVTIQIENDTHIPCTITSARWIGLFSEVTREG